MMSPEEKGTFKPHGRKGFTPKPNYPKLIQLKKTVVNALCEVLGDPLKQGSAAYTLSRTRYRTSVAFDVNPANIVTRENYNFELLDHLDVDNTENQTNWRVLCQCVLVSAMHLQSRGQTSVQAAERISKAIINTNALPKDTSMAEEISSRIVEEIQKQSSSTRKKER